jgi:S-adenosylmethionine decarboxylase
LNKHPDHQPAAVATPLPPLVNQTQSLGRHILAEFYDCDANALNNLSLVETVMKDAADACGATVVESRFHHFNPHGISGVVIIAESHLAIHTWPELEYAAIDLFTCGDECDPLVAYNYVREHLHAGHATYSELRRGLINPTTQKLERDPFAVRTQFHTPAAANEATSDACATVNTVVTASSSVAQQTTMAKGV